MATRFMVREAIELDFPFIYSTWLKGLRYGWDEHELYRKSKDTGEFFKAECQSPFSVWDQKSYFRDYHQVIEAILKRPGVLIRVACLNDDTTTILGYAIVQEPTTLHYVHVKSAFRKFGIARELCPKDIKLVTQITKSGWAILRKKFPHAIFNPVL